MPKYSEDDAKPTESADEAPDTDDPCASSWCCFCSVSKPVADRLWKACKTTLDNALNGHKRIPYRHRGGGRCLVYARGGDYNRYSKRTSELGQSRRGLSSANIGM